MNLLFLGIICAVVALIAAAFISAPAPGRKAKKQKKPGKERPQPENSPALVPEYRARQLEEELNTAKADASAAKAELEALKKGYEDLKAESAQKEKWVSRDDSELEKTKKENILFKEKLVNKEKELEKEFSLNFNLDKGLKEKTQRLEASEKENKAMKDEIMALQAKVSGYQKETQEQKKIIEAAKKKEEQSEWISKKEYNELKQKLTEKENEIKGPREKP
ncbi:MAG: hypothetical protein PHR44_02600 [Candidatus Omnitrophica bacterium]|nr:hypothetical protein [Candidatus Omnitrophota bacterium]